MKVLVTGGAGKVGQYVLRELVARGHQPTAAGRSKNVELSDSEYISLDCTDYLAVRQAVQEHDAVIHLAAIPGPNLDTSERIFHINCTGAFNIYQACADSAGKRLAVSSSINALGMWYGVREVPVHYFPIDEDHPSLCSDVYSFSKKITEEIGEFFWQKNRMSSVAIRIPAVVECKDGHFLRFAGGHEKHHRIMNLWTWIDARDSARIFVDGIEKNYDGFHVLFANDKVNNAGIPSRDLAAKFFPHVNEWRENVQGMQSLISCCRAKALLDWEPIYTTRPEQI